MKEISEKQVILKDKDSLHKERIWLWIIQYLCIYRLTHFFNFLCFRLFLSLRHPKIIFFGGGLTQNPFPRIFFFFKSVLLWWEHIWLGYIEGMRIWVGSHNYCVVQDIEKKSAEMQEAGKEKVAIEKNYKKLEETSKVISLSNRIITLV